MIGVPYKSSQFLMKSLSTLFVPNFSIKNLFSLKKWARGQRNLIMIPPPMHVKGPKATLLFLFGSEKTHST